MSCGLRLPGIYFHCFISVFILISFNQFIAKGRNFLLDLEIQFKFGVKVKSNVNNLKIYFFDNSRFNSCT